jgi:hypothetical protein
MKTERHEDYWLTTQRFGTRLLLCEGVTRKDSVRGMSKMLAERKGWHPGLDVVGVMLRKAEHDMFFGESK